MKNEKGWYSPDLAAQAPAARPMKLKVEISHHGGGICLFHVYEKKLGGLANNIDETLAKEIAFRINSFEGEAKGETSTVANELIKAVEKWQDSPAPVNAALVLKVAERWAKEQGKPI